MEKDKIYNVLKKCSNEALSIIKECSKYKKYILEYLEDDYKFLLNAHIFNEFIYAEKWAYKWVLNNLDKFIIPENNSKYTRHVYIIMKKAIMEGNDKLLKSLIYHKDLHIVRTVMVDLSQRFPTIFIKYYGSNILKYIHSYDNDGNIINTIEEKYLSKIAANLADNRDSEFLYYILRDYILNTFPYNRLAHYLRKIINRDLFKKELNVLFPSQHMDKYDLIHYYEDYIDDDKVASFNKQMAPFLNARSEVMLDTLREPGGTIYLDNASKYLELSEDKTIKYISGGSVCTICRVGDYVIKYFNKQYIDKRFKMPKVFLIDKKYEEAIEYVDGDIEYGIRVQKYHKRSVRLDSLDIFRKFRKELWDLGFFWDDYVVRGASINLMYLDDYHEADCDDPESLPDWFKENPIVLVDIDLVYPVWALLLNDLNHVTSIKGLNEELGYDKEKGQSLFLELHKD